MTTSVPTESYPSSESDRLLEEDGVPQGAPYTPYEPQEAAPYQVQPSVPVATVKDYMVQAILVTFLCLPIGIAAIISATKVNPALQLGNLPEAMRASKRAKTLCWIGLAVGVVLWLFVMAIMFAAAASGGGGGTDDYYYYDTGY